MTTLRPGSSPGFALRPPEFSRAPPGFSAWAAMDALGDLSVLGGAAALATDLDVTHELLAVGAAPLCMHSSPTSPSAR